jgi:hypothetical protein
VCLPLLRGQGATLAHFFVALSDFAGTFFTGALLSGAFFAGPFFAGPVAGRPVFGECFFIWLCFA